jgi:hypothetical protein
MIRSKKCAAGKIENTKGAAKSVGLIAFCLKYGMYVVHLSQWFVFLLIFKF